MGNKARGSELEQITQMYYTRIFLQSVYLRPNKNGNEPKVERKRGPNHIVKSNVPLKRRKIEKKVSIKFQNNCGLRKTDI